MQNYVNYFSVNVFVLAGVFCQQIKKKPTILSEMSKVIKTKKFTMSMQYPKKKGRCKVGFLHIDNYQTFLQVDAINFGRHGQSYSKYLT